MRTALEAAYVLSVAAVAIVGFTTGSTALILGAAALALPSGIAVIPAYYLGYMLLALVPGANPSSSSGSGGCTPDGCYEVTSPGLAPWFVVATDVLGVALCTAAALLNVLLLRWYVRLRRPVNHDFAGRLPGW